MNRSSKYSFYMPENSDPIAVNDFNYNFQVIDENLITEAQTWTDTQKENALANIGAADADSVTALSNSVTALSHTVSTLSSQVENNEDETLSLVFNAYLTNTNYTTCYMNEKTKLVCLQVYITASIDIDSTTSLIGGLPALKNEKMVQWFLYDFEGASIKPCYVDTDNTVKVRGGLTNGHTYFGTIMYMSE